MNHEGKAQACDCKTRPCVVEDKTEQITEPRDVNNSSSFGKIYCSCKCHS